MKINKERLAKEYSKKYEGLFNAVMFLKLPNEEIIQFPIYSPSYQICLQWASEKATSIFSMPYAIYVDGELRYQHDIDKL